MPNQEADTVAQAVMDNFVCRFGCPIGVLSDQAIQLQPSLHNVEEDRNLPTDPNVGEHAVERSPLTMDPAPMENAAVISDESDARVQHSARSRHSPAWMEDFLLGNDFDNALPPLGRGGV